jgi:hypothetical protein
MLDMELRVSVGCACACACKEKLNKKIMRKENYTADRMILTRLAPKKRPPAEPERRFLVLADAPAPQTNPKLTQWGSKL